MTPQDVARKLRDSLGLQGRTLLAAGRRAGPRIRLPHLNVSDLETRTRSRAGREAFGVSARAEGMFGFRESGGRSARSTGIVMGSDSHVAGGLARHVPVLVHSVIGQLGVRDGGVYVDGTFGAGGYTRAILAASNCQVVAIDRDRTAIANGADLVQESAGRLALVEDRFSELDNVARRLGHQQVDGVVLDIGVSSMQLDQAERGFSFRFDGPLDMRMAGEGPSAADVVERASESDLADIIYQLGEERHSRAVARAIVKARADKPITTTQALAEIVARVVHTKPGAIHPATRTFQALRIFVNEELHELVTALEAAERVLKPGGHLVVVSFHSLEDRIVKTFFNEHGRNVAGSRHAPVVEGPAPTFTILTKRPVEANETEIAANPRARSAKLRAAARSAEVARAGDNEHLLPRLPTLAAIMRGH